MEGKKGGAGGDQDVWHGQAGVNAEWVAMVVVVVVVMMMVVVKTMEGSQRGRCWNGWSLKGLAGHTPRCQTAA